MMNVPVSCKLTGFMEERTMSNTNELELFPLGRIVMTKGVAERLGADDVLRGIFRHSSGDWGDVCEDDQLANEVALNNGDRLLSSYRAAGGTKFWIITEHDRSVTTILLPDES